MGGVGTNFPRPPASAGGDMKPGNMHKQPCEALGVFAEDSFLNPGIPQEGGSQEWDFLGHPAQRGPRLNLAHTGLNMTPK